VTLALRLMFVVVAMVSVALLGEAWLHLQHESGVHRADLEHELRSQGVILREALAAQGPDAAQRFLRSLREVSDLRAQLVTRAALDESGLDGAERGAVWEALAEPGEESRFVYMADELIALTPVLGLGDLPEAVLIQRAELQPGGVYVLEGLRRVGAQLVLVLALTALVAVWLGERLVSRPLELLAGYAQQISAGQFDPERPLRLTGEFAGLELELRQMAATLAVVDASLRRETEEKTRALEHLRHTDRLRTVGTLAAGIAHDLGTPLQIVLARAERLARKSDDDRTRSSAAVIVEQTLRMDQIVRQLMRFAAPRPATRRSHDLRLLVQQACALVAPLDRKIMVRLALGEDPLPAVVDSDHIEQVVVNLVANAIDASAEGSTVSVQMSRVGGAACLEVIDQGAGMDDETAEQAFDPFFTTKGVGRGTGLGLAVVYGIVQEYGGSIKLTSAEGLGSRFELRLPLHEEPA